MVADRSLVLKMSRVLLTLAILLAPGAVPSVSGEAGGAVVEKPPDGPVKVAIKTYVLSKNGKKTSRVTLIAELYPDKAPITVANFLQYAREGFYDGTIFHRISGGLKPWENYSGHAKGPQLIQGGGYTIRPKADPGYSWPYEIEEKEPTRAPIRNEAGNGLANDRGTIAMARKHPVIDSAASQFFINLTDNDHLNHKESSAEKFGYAVFGKILAEDLGDKVVEGVGWLETLSRTSKTTQVGRNYEMPEAPIVIESIEVIE